MYKISPVVLACTSLLFTAGAFAQHGKTYVAQSPSELRPSKQALPDFDIREKVPQVGAKVSVGTSAAAKAFRQRIPSATVKLNEQAGSLRHLFTTKGALSAARTGSPETVVKQFISETSELFGLTDSDIQSFVTASQDTDQTSGVTHVTLHREVAGVHVFETEIKAHVDRGGQLVSVEGNYFPGSMVSTLQPKLSVEDAVRAAMRDVAPDILAKSGANRNLAPPTTAGPIKISGQAAFPWVVSKDAGPDHHAQIAGPYGPIVANLVFFPTGQELRLAWEVNTQLHAREAAYTSLIDAESGELLYRRNNVKYVDARKALVFQKDPDSGGRVLTSFVGDATASPSGWSSGNSTSGNNAASADATSTGDFVFPFVDAARSGPLPGFDLENRHLRLTPNDATATSYSVTTSVAPTVTAGTLDVGAILSNKDDGSLQLSCSNTSATFQARLLGRLTSNLWVNANGSVSLQPIGSYVISKVDFADDVPRIAGLWDDLNLNLGGSLTAACYSEGTGLSMRFAWMGVPSYASYGSGTQTFAITIHGLGTGLDNVVDIDYNSIYDKQGVLVGIGGTSSYSYDSSNPGTVNYVDLSKGVDAGIIGGIAQTFPEYVDMAASVTNLAYQLNRTHDYFYQLGFTEAAGNFQLSNFGRGGNGRDAVRGEVQFGLGYYNNAFMSSSPSDGIAPFAAFGIFNQSDDCVRDSALDAGVITHEYTHGVVQRVVRQQSGVQAGALGEGWGDTFAFLTTRDPVMGGYVSCRPDEGMRTVRYDVSPHTFGRLGSIAGPYVAYVGGSYVSPAIGQVYLPEVHADGEIWASVTWDINAVLGPEAAAKLIFEGMRYTPYMPSMIDARDGILIADSMLSAGAHLPMLLQVFAKRGLGASAATFGYPNYVGAGNDGAVFAAFDLPSASYGKDKSVIYQTDFESDTGGWATEGSDGKGGPALWHLTSTKGATGSHSFYYGDESTFTYSTGYRNYGALRSPVINLPANIPQSTALILEWDQWRATSTVGVSMFDGGWVRIIDVSSGVRTQVAVVSDSNYGWQNYRVNLNQFAGKQIRVEFYTDTFDSSNNNYPGWYIDNVTVSLLVDKPILTSPDPESSLPGVQANFAWSSGSGPSEYWLIVGSSYGATDIYNESQGVNTSKTISNLPNDGRALFVRLWSKIGDTWLLSESKYTAATDGRSRIVNPSMGSSLSGSTAAFTWTPGTGVSEHWLVVGSTYGSDNIYNANLGAGTSTTVTGLPTHGKPLYVRLWSKIGGNWVVSESQYFAAIDARAQMLTPAPGSTLYGTTANFTWSAGSGVSEYYLYVGSTQGGFDLYTSGTTATSATVNGLPSDGTTIYVRLWSHIGSVWQYYDYQYVSYYAAIAQMTAPVAGSTLAGTQATFAWTTGAQVSEYYLSIGSAKGGVEIYSASAGIGRAATVTGLPTDGRTVYVRLWSRIGTQWYYRDYTYLASPDGRARILSPVPGSVLSGTATFVWQYGSGVTESWLVIGSKYGADDIYSVNRGTATSATVTGLPTNGQTLYVRLWSHIGASWSVAEYTYQAGSDGRAQMISPLPGSVLAGPSVTFSWSTGVSVSQYALVIGSTHGGGDIYVGSPTAATSQTVTVPTDGRTVYVRLWSNVAGIWQAKDYSYRSATR